MTSTGEDTEVDVDVAVIGAGVAGLVAALRVRRPEVVAALPASAMILEGERPGGMLNWGGRSAFHIAGPGYRFRSEDWDRLMEEAAELALPIVREPVIAASLAGPIKELRTPDRTVRAHAVIVAAGAFPMRNAAGLRPRDGLITAFGGVGQVHDTIRRIMQKSGRGALALFGTQKIVELAAFLGDLAPVVLVEPPYVGEPPPGVAVGTLVRIVGEPGISGLEYRDREGALRLLPCDCIHADFNSYMDRTGSTAFLAGAGITGEDGFIVTDREMATAIPGVFAAGDVTGGMFAVSKSIYEGVRAGFSALRHVHRVRRGFEPNLYPFYYGQFGVQLGVFHQPPGRRLAIEAADGGDPEGRALVVTLEHGEVVRAPIDARHMGFWQRVVDANRPFHVVELASAAGLAPAVAVTLLFELVRLGGLQVGAPVPG